MHFSLVIPVAPERNAEIIESIRHLDYPEKQYEVLVTKGANPSHNRNRGAGIAQGDIIAFLDDDALIPGNYLREAEKFFLQHPDIDIVGGPQLTSKNDKGFSKISWYALSSSFGTWKVANRYAVRKLKLNADETSVSSANLLCRRQVLKKIEFDTNLYPGEDPKFIAEAQKAGFKIAYTPTIRLYHKRRPTLATLMKQTYSYGKARPQKEPLLQTLRMPFFFVPSLFILYLAALLTVLCLHPGIAAEALAPVDSFSGSSLTSKILFMPVIVYAGLTVFFSIYDAARHKDYKVMAILPVIYPAIHLSYGCGMIGGYIKKLLRI